MNDINPMPACNLGPFPPARGTMTGPTRVHLEVVVNDNGDVTEARIEALRRIVRRAA